MSLESQKLTVGFEEPISIPKKDGKNVVIASPPSDFMNGNMFSPPRTGFSMSPARKVREIGDKPLTQFSNQEIKFKILLLENINQTGIDIFQKNGFEIQSYSKALPTEELKEKIRDVHVIGIRSKTLLTKEILNEAKNLIAIGCFCIGTNQVDLSCAEEKGIPVFNSPFSNSRSVAELVMGEIIALSRHLGDKNFEMHKSIWKKPLVQECFEIRGKTLGIIGYGHIGTQLSVLAESMGMRVIFYDVLPLMPLGTAKPVASLEELLGESDFVSLHVPETEQTKNMIGAEQLKQMKKGSYLVNNSRGTVVDLKALATYLKNGHLMGAAVDVYPKEPEANGPGFQTDIIGCSNVLLTPHIGGSTEEAQRAIGVEVANALTKYLKTGSSVGSVNFPNVELKNPPPNSQIIRILNIHENVPGVLKQIHKCLSAFNISKQVCDSTEKTAYLVADLNMQDQNFSDLSPIQEIENEISKIPESISVRILY